MATAQLAWREKVVGHYGSIDAFDDARTIRIMLADTKAWLAEDKRIYDTLPDDAAVLEDWTKIFKDDRDGHTALQAELEAWLHKRGLEP